MLISLIVAGGNSFSMKWLIIISLVAFIPQITYSQYYGEIHIGVATSKMNIPKQFEVNNTAVINPIIQGSIIKILGPKFSWVLAVQFGGYGFAADENEKNPKTVYRLHYALVIPKIEYRISPKFGATSGISFGKLISTERKYDNEKWMNVDEFRFFKDFEFGISCGLQYNVGNFIFGVSYFNGLSNIANEGEGWMDPNHVLIDKPVANNRSLSMGLSYRFRL